MSTVNDAHNQLRNAMADRLMPLGIPLTPTVERLAWQLIEEVQELDVEAARRIIRICGAPPWRIGEPPPAEWWGTALGRLCLATGVFVGGPCHVTEAATILGVARNTVYRYINDDLLPLTSPGYTDRDRVLALARSQRSLP